MAILDTIYSIEENLSKAYTSLQKKGATIPQQTYSVVLPTALYK